MVMMKYAEVNDDVSLAAFDDLLIVVMSLFGWAAAGMMDEVTCYSSSTYHQQVVTYWQHNSAGV